MQLSLFDEQKWQRRKLTGVMDEIRNRFGATAKLRAVSLTDSHSHQTLRASRRA
ncbi:hypothetical protein [Sporosarcina sp. YIM B06819]|uniref:hypothetical protein n=1 Tax=Sporosarcina sp. YIM B06819 TaxID=3081769 RepID=UPI00298BD377|nr:hypothetical protein [Sporosarcina sp. YIM B06819]